MEARAYLKHVRISLAFQIWPDFSVGVEAMKILRFVV